MNAMRVNRSAILLAVCILLSLAAEAAFAQEYLQGEVRLHLEGGVSIPGDDFTRDQAGYTINPFGMAGVEYFIIDNIAARGDVFAGILTNTAGDLLLRKFYKLAYNTVEYSTTLMGFTAGVSITTPPLLGFRGAVTFRGGLLFHSTEILFDARAEHHGETVVTFGPALALEYPLTPAMTIGVQYSALFTSSDFLDGVEYSGSNHDGFSTVTLGVSWNLNPASTPGMLLPPRGSSPEFPDKLASRIPDVGMPEDGAAIHTETHPAQRGRDADPASTTPDAETVVASRPSDTRDSRTTPGEEAAPEGTRSPVETRAPDGPLSTSVSVSDFANIPSLKSDPQALELTVEKRSPGDIPVEIRFELMQEGRNVASSSRRMMLREAAQKFSAREFLDLEGIQGDDASLANLPTGEYDITVSVHPDDGTPADIASLTFTHIDYESLFGPEADRVRYLVNSRRASATLMPSNEVVFNTFGRDFPRTTSSARKHSFDNRLQSSAGVVRDAARIAPEGMSASERQSYLGSMVRESLSKALLILNASSKSPAARERLSAVLGEVYFPFDGAQLTEEGKAVLDQVAQILHQHPELNAEIRGFADEIGDDAYNVLLSQRRADRVYEYLNRKQIPDSRIHSHGVGRSTADPDAAPEQRQRQRKVQIILGEGML